MNNLSNLKVLVCGQLISSRTETIEEYLKGKISKLGVIGITSPFAIENVSRYSLYKKGKLVGEYKLPSFQIRNMKWFKQPLLCISFAMYVISIFYSIFRLREKFDVFIGIACFSAFIGIFLKKIKIVKNLIYYSIDYYPWPPHFSFSTFIIASFRIADKLCVKNANLTWHISPRIPDARCKYAKVSPDGYKHLVCPLTYDSKFQRFKPIEEVEHYTIGFVGTLSENQGLQLLIKAMPKIIKALPKVRIRIIGRGPYENELKKMVEDENLDSHFLFHGFIKDNDKVLDILSKCAIGIAPWTSKEDDNVLYADPGKPKLYAFCGLPIIITKGALVAEEIGKREAGISINYDENELIKAAIELLKDEDRLRKYKKNTCEFAMDYSTDKIFDSVFRRSLGYLN